MNTIKHSLPVTEILAGLAEEATELAHAALKLRRVFDGTNPTPKNEEEAIMDLWEEIADVKIYCSLLDVNPKEISRIMDEKINRWRERLMRRDAK